MRGRKHLSVRNPHEAVPDILKARRAIVVEYTHPHECVLIWPGADPFRHFFDALQAIAVWPRTVAPHRLMETQVAYGKLEMRVLSEPHDFLASGFARFSMLQEFLARALGVGIGVLQHTIIAGHRYDKVSSEITPYEGVCPRMPLIRTAQEIWMQDLRMLLDEGGAAMGYRDPFFRCVAVPMWQTRREYLAGNLSAARGVGGRIRADDWRMAVMHWIKGAMDVVEK